MKRIGTRLTVLIAALCGMFAATSVFGQTTFIWTNQNPTFPAIGNLGVAANWTNVATGANGLANPANTDTVEWNGSTTGNLALTLNANYNGSAGQPGINFYMNSNQVANLQIGPPAGVNGATPRANGVLIDAGAGQFKFGDDSLNSLEIVWGSAFTHGMENNSSQPAIVYPNLLWRMGGGGTHFYDYRGTGDWIVNSYMRNDNNAGSGVIKSGSGTLYWYGTNVPAATVPGVVVNGGLTVDSGTVYLKTFDLLTTIGGIQNDPVGAGGTLVIYDAPLTNNALTVGGAGNIAAAVTGFGPLEVRQGKLTLSGFNTYSGTNILTGGELVAGRLENFGVNGPLGQGGTITFNGGTLGFSSANSFDYSPRFNTGNNQAYNIDIPSGITVHFATGLISSGGSLSLVGGGTLSLDGANTYNGLTTVSAGTLVIQGTRTGAGNITVLDGAALGLNENGTQVTPSTLALGSSSGANLQFNNVTNTSTAPIAPTSVSSTGTQTIDVLSGAFNTIGQVFPLLTWSSGSGPAVSLGIKNGFDGFLSTNINTIQLTITETPYIWTGTNGNSWDLTTANNWVQSGVSKTFVNNVLAVFDDSSAVTNVVITNGLVQPRTLTFNNSVNPYSVTNSTGNNIAGSTGLTKNGNGILMLPGGANTYTGVTMINGGILSVDTLANGGAASDIGAASGNATNLVVNGGTLLYTGSGATIDRLFSVGTAGGTIDGSGAGSLSLTQNGNVGLAGSGAHSLTLRGASSNSLAANIVDGSGATSLTKNDAGDWVLTGTNTYSGGTVILGGLVEVGTGGTRGALGTGNILNNGSIRFNRSGSLTVNGAISGGGSVTNDGTGTTILAGNNSYLGVTANNVGTLQIGNGGTPGSLAGGANIYNNGTLIFNSTASTFYNGGSGIHGTGNVRIQAGTVKAVGNNDYTGWTQIDSGATFTPTDNNSGNINTLSTLVITNNGTLRLEGYITRNPMYANIVGGGRLQVGGTGGIFDAGDNVLAGTNTYSGGTFIGGEHLILGDGFTPIAGSIAGNVTFVNNFEDGNDNVRRLIFNRPDDFTFSGNITTNFNPAQNNQGIVNQRGIGVLTLTGNNTYGSGTVIEFGTLQVGNGGTTGSIGTGNVTDNSLLIWNRSNDAALRGTITGTGAFVKMGAGSLTLNGVISFAGDTTVSNGTLVVAGALATGIVSVGGNLNLEGGTLISGAYNAVVSNNITGNLNLNSGTVVATLNRAGPLTNTTYSAFTINAVAGTTLKLLNAGPLLEIGDTFSIFSQPVTGGAGMNIVSPGFTVTNNLAVDGSVTVTAVLPPPTLTSTQSGTNLILSWPSAYIGSVHLQGQTNTLSTGLSNNWVSIPGTELVNTFTNPIVKSTNRTVFFRLIQP